MESARQRRVEQVRQRANGLCEYCHTNELWQYVPFTVDHILPLSAGGADSLANLALACFHCNRRKSAHQTLIDQETSEEVALFHPRLHRWADHFIWSVDRLLILPRTAIGRATISLLEMNRPRVLLIRHADLDVNRHPPGGDPIAQ